MFLSKINPQKIQQIAPKAGFVGTLFLCFALIVTIFFYDDPAYQYSILNHFISDLGNTKVSPCFWLFSLGLCVGGPCLGILIVGIALQLNHKIGYAALVVGLISCVACFFVGIFPADVALAAHLIAALIFFFGALITAALFSVALALDKTGNIPKIYILPSLLIVINGAIFLALPPESVREFLKNKDAFQRPDFWINPFWEWLVLFSILIWAIALSRFLKKNAVKR